MERSSTEKKIDKLEEKLDATFVSDIKSMNLEQLEAAALKYAKEMERVEAERDDHKELANLKLAVKDLSKGFSDCRKAARERMQYALYFMSVKES